MARTLRLIRCFWHASIAAEMEYRLNFLLELVAAILGLAGSLFVLSLFYQRGGNLGGWEWESALVVLGIYTVLDGFTSTLLQPNLSRIVTHVQEGTLDFVLLKPTDSQAWLSLRQLSPWGLPNVVFGAGIILYGIHHSPGGVTAGKICVGALALTCSVLCLYSLWFVLATTSIWFVKVWNATEVLRSFLEAGRFPMSSYPAGLRIFFTFVLPVAFLTTVPAEALLGQSHPTWLVAAVLLAALLMTLSRAFWKFALRFYTSASS